MNAKRTLTRRKVVLGLAGAGVVGAVAAMSQGEALSGALRRTAGLAPAEPLPAALARAGYDEWRHAVGRTFVATGGYRLRLAGVRAAGSTANRAGQPGVRSRAFVALFDVMGGQTMAGDLIYGVTRGRERFDVFLNASGSPQRMLAVFG